jgi:hypothetical protein
MSPPVEDMEVETPYAASAPTSPRAQAAVDAPPPITQPAPSSRTNVPPALRASPTPPRAPTRELERISPEASQPPPSIVERTLERRLELQMERTHVVERSPVAAPPPKISAADVAAIRPPESRRSEIETAVRFIGDRRAARDRDIADAAPDAVHISIGRIDVRAIGAPAPRSPPERAKPAPMGLDEYLRRRNGAS